MIVPAVRTLLCAALLALPVAAANDATQNSQSAYAPTQHNEATVAQLQAEMASGTLTSEALTKYYITRIIALDQNGPGVNAVIELNPDALEMARACRQTAQARHRAWALTRDSGAPQRQR